MGIFCFAIDYNKMTFGYWQPIPTHFSAIEKYLRFGHFSDKPKISTGKSMAGIGFYNGKFEKSQKKCHFHRQTCFFLHGIQTLVCID